MKALLLGVVTLIGVARPARADSDGYYCASATYLAVELRSFSTPRLRAPHVVRIVRLDGATGPRVSGEVALPDFQPHRMVCAADSVTIEGWDRGFLSYVIGVDGHGAPRIRNQLADPARKFDPRLSDGPLEQLGDYAQPGTIPLPAGVPFRLHVRRQCRKNDCVTRTSVEQLNAAGNVTRALLVRVGAPRSESVD